MNEKRLPHDHGQELELHTEKIPETSEFKAASDLFAILGDATRLRIFWILCHCEECVVNIACLMEMSSPAVAHHLRVLRSAGLITSRKEGREVYYKAAETSAAEQLHRMTEQMMEITCPKDC